LITFGRPNWERVEYVLGNVSRPDFEVRVYPFKLGILGIYQRLLTSVVVPLTREKFDVILNTHGDWIPTKTDLTYIHGGMTYALPLAENPALVKYRGFWRLYYEPYWRLTKSLCAPGLVLTNSIFSQKYLASAGISSTVVYPPIETGYSSLAGKSARSNEILTLSRISPEKELEIIPEIASLTMGKIYHIVGTTTVASQRVIRAIVRRAKELGVRDKIRFHLDPSAKDVLSLQSICKVYLHTMKHEHFGMAVAESMSIGCLPVAYEGGGIPEFVPEENLYRTPEEAGEIIEELCDSWTVEKSERISESVEWLNPQRFGREICSIIEGLKTKSA